MNKLTLSMLDTLFIEKKEKNWVFSPASMMEATKLLKKCINGKNLQELEDVASNLDSLKAAGVENYNCMLYASDFADNLIGEVIEEILETGADLKEFSGPEVISLVNKIVEEKTHGKITDLLSPDDYSPELRVVLLNCIYFKKKWSYNFDDSHYTDKFYGATTDSDIKYLRKQEPYNFYEDKDIDIVELNYRDSNISCYLLVPTGNIFDIFQNLNENIKKIALTNYQNIQCHVTVPPFKTESTIDLSKPMINAGLKNVWNKTQDWTLFDFNKLGPDSYAQLSFAKQKTYIDFTKDGTEATAATTFGLVCFSGYCGSFEPKKVKYVRADKPFVYVLTETKNPENPLFVGVINNL